MPGLERWSEVDEWLSSVRLTPLMDVPAFVRAARRFDRDAGSGRSAGVDGHLARRFREGESAERQVALAALRARGVRLYRLTNGGTILSSLGASDGQILPPISDFNYDELVSRIEVRDEIDHPKVGLVSRWLTRRVTKVTMRR